MEHTPARRPFTGKKLVPSEFTWHEKDTRISLINLEGHCRSTPSPSPTFRCGTFHGVNSTVSGVGYNVPRPSHAWEAGLISCLSRAMMTPETVHSKPSKNVNVGLNYIIRALEKTPHSVILYDREGKRQIHVDLKNIQEEKYPLDLFENH